MAPSLKKPTSVNDYNDITSDAAVANGYSVNKSMMADELTWTYLTLKRLAALILGLPLIVMYFCSIPLICYPLVVLILFVPVFALFLGVNNFLYSITYGRNLVSKIDNYITFVDEDAKRLYKGKFIPMRDLYEMYADGKINFRLDVLETLEKREEFASYRLQWWHLKFFLLKFVPEMLHFKQQDREQVCDHYNRGNDFYASFLGSTMIYTSGMMKSQNESLEEMQRNKLKTVCEKINLHRGERHLDIGCGWGTLVNYAAENYGTDSIGVTIAQEQIDWAKGKSKEALLEGKSSFLCMDYRDIPKSKYDKITCLEMSEHVGIRLYPTFLKQVSDMLEDDGIFYLQIAGIRRAWQWEDFLWAFFMDTYIFPGADASLPLTFPIAELEAAGFEVQSVETIGIHYSETIKRWYYNWIKPEHKVEMVKKYGNRLYRIWEIFLAWSTIIARQGNSTCYQIVAHKNLNRYPRSNFIRSNKTTEKLEY